MICRPSHGGAPTYLRTGRREDKASNPALTLGREGGPPSAPSADRLRVRGIFTRRVNREAERPSPARARVLSRTRKNLPGWQVCATVRQTGVGALCPLPTAAA